ncbi:Transcriptional regulator, RpiR family [Kosakonia radicincitans]|nr:Transcriptional regulator, RpiR family [Kosakonia radicincitans]
MSAKTASLEGRIRQHWDQLSSHEQRLADVLLAAPGQLAMNTATELAQSAGVSKATTTRFFRHLGYESYEAARRQRAKCKAADRRSTCKPRRAHRRWTA